MEAEMSKAVAELTVNELKQLVRAVVRETLQEILADPDAGLELRDNLADYLRLTLAEDAAGTLKTIRADELAAKLGLDW